MKKILLKNIIFIIESDNLIEKLNNNNLNNVDNDKKCVSIFEEDETLNEFENIIYIKKENGTKRYRTKLAKNIIENIF